MLNKNDAVTHSNKKHAHSFILSIHSQTHTIPFRIMFIAHVNSMWHFITDAYDVRIADSSILIIKFTECYAILYTYSDEHLTLLVDKNSRPYVITSPFGSSFSNHSLLWPFVTVRLPCIRLPVKIKNMLHFEPEKQMLTF